MLAITPEFATRVAHLPRATAFDPKTSFLFSNWKPAFIIQASFDLIN
jgi:hypothetical protein